MSQTFKECIAKRPFFTALLVNLILFSLFFLFHHPRFAINDDPAMMSIASGLSTGEPSEYLIFINIIIGHLLKNLYTAMPGLNWYVILLYLIHFVSLTIILYIFLLNRYSVYSLILFLLLFVFTSTSFLTNLQFTTTAFAAGISGLLLLLRLKETTVKKSLTLSALAVTMLVTAGLIRGSVFYAMLAIGLPLIIFKAYQQKNLHNLIALAISALLFLAASNYDSFSYQKDPDWNYYSQYNSLRANLTDYPQYAYDENTKDIYNAVGWTENRVNMFRSWSFADRDIFALEDLTYIVEHIEAGPVRDISSTFSAFFFGLVLVRHTDLSGFLFTFAVFIMTILVVRREDKQYWYVALLMVTAAAVYLAYGGRLPARVLYPLLYFLCCYAFYFLTKDRNNVFRYIQNLSRHRGYIYIALTLICIGIFLLDAQKSYNNKAVQERINQNLEQLNSQQYIYATWPFPGRFYPLIFSVNYIPKFYNPDTIIPDTISFGGSFTHSPHNYRRLSKFDVKNVYLALVERDDILLVAEPERIEGLLAEFMKENYNITIRAEQVVITPDVPTFRIKEVRDGDYSFQQGLY
jgi:hypothetical protein